MEQATHAGKNNGRKIDDVPRRRHRLVLPRRMAMPLLGQRLTAALGSSLVRLYLLSEYGRRLQLALPKSPMPL